ncbi:MAG: hypothetical protein GXO83_06985 [Chlorobi bacterium]|nr:hypothetical protein [Chlorobiota bacterium]
MRNLYIAEAEKYLGHKWEVLPASVFLEFARNGNRTNYSKIYTERRKTLSILVFAEIFENKDRFTDDIVNLTWAICEETFWGVPAHLGMQKAGVGLPDTEEPIVDLFAAETGSMLAWVSYLVGEKLDKVSPLVQKRIHYEINRRILTPNLERTDFWWMGFGEGKVNNWNPWINSNWLACVLLCEEDNDRRIDALHKIMLSLDNFINGYPDDGGCDEGPQYWGKAAGALYLALELFDKASSGSINIFDQELIKNMGAYIYKVYIGNDYYVNFADASAKAGPSPALIYRYGKSINDDVMTHFAAYLAEKHQFGNTIITDTWGQFTRLLPELLQITDLRRIKGTMPSIRDTWLPQTELMTARSTGNSLQSFYVSAKGGHNAESHNHNDVGSFMVYYEGNPVLIDIGVETYTAKTFSSHRYEIWTMQSAYHNLPLINGQMQAAGREYAANNIKYKESDSKAVLSMDISKAYPAEANVISWERTITLNRGKNIVIAEKYKLNKVTGNISLNFMTVQEPDASIPGKIKITGKKLNGDSFELAMFYDKSKFTAIVEDMEITDPRLKNTWGDRLYRIVLKWEKPDIKGNCKTVIKEL